jgi:hypothetical protein
MLPEKPKQTIVLHKFSLKYGLLHLQQTTARQCFFFLPFLVTGSHPGVHVFYCPVSPRDCATDLEYAMTPSLQHMEWVLTETCNISSQIRHAYGQTDMAACVITSCTSHKECTEHFTGPSS